MTEHDRKSGLRRPGRGGGHARRVAALLRDHFALAGGWVVTVAELRCLTPGCPPVETVALLWDAEGARHRLRVFRPLAEVSRDDLPPRWYLPALRAEDGDDGCC